MKVLILAQQGLEREMGMSAPAALELRRVTRDFAAFWEKRGGFSLPLPLLGGPQFTRR